MTKFDLTVIGAGHAGIEAAHIAAKMGASVLLVTGNPDLIGQMSCNPAIGGVAKGNIVREIDALGGLMASLIDRAGIQFRMLNSTKGSAVWGPRAQADKVMYRNLARKEMENCPNLAILQGMVSGISVLGGKIAAVTLDNGEKIDTGAVIVAAGTFLNGVMYNGPHSRSGGRAGEPPALGLTESVRELGITSGRLRTCTPPRIDGRTVDYSKLAEQRGDDEPWPFSFFTRGKLSNKASCWAARTNAETHKHILEYMERARPYAEKEQTAGPRYCPSIEEKVIRFGERDGHTLYLEPESLDSREVYINGLFTALPLDVQERVVASVAGLEGARVVRPGYEIEYDYFQPLQLRPTLESRIVGGLFFAGQVNGTSGYEEAACQGLIAGINAVRALRGEEPVVLGRDTSYIGVLIDDLVTKGTDEPYRMFTSRAEYRLILRQDNCDERLMPIAHRLGTVSDEQYDERRRFWDRKRGAVEWLSGVRVAPEQYARVVDGGVICKSEPAVDLLRRPEVGLEALLEVIVDNELINNEKQQVHREMDVEKPEKRGQHVDNVEKQADVGERQRVSDDINAVEAPNSCDEECGKVVDVVDNLLGMCGKPLFDRHLALGVESDIKYEGFIRKQVKEIEKIRRFEKAKIPDDFSYDAVPGLLNESRQKLKAIRPDTLGKASRVSGVTPADISVLAVYMCRASVA